MARASEGQPPTPIAQLVVTGVVVAILAAFADSLVTWAIGRDPAVPPGDFALATLALVCFYAPAGALVGLALAPIRLALRRAGPLRARLFAPIRARALYGANPGLIVPLWSGLLAVAAFVGATQGVVRTFAERFHEATLAAWATAVAVLGVAIGCALLFVVSRIVLRPIVESLRWTASLLTTGIAGVVVAIILVSDVSYRYPSLALTYRIERLVWAPAVLLVFTAAAVLLARAAYRGRPRARTIRIAASLAGGFAALTIFGAAMSYGPNNRLRVVVEDRSVAGGFFVRSLLEATDRDGDGVSFAFGGDDCDDSDASIYPGAPDPEGDGIDSDCFGGDGSPTVVAMTDGEYGDVPPSVPRRPNILFLSLDALRPDHLGYRYDRPTSPHTDAFAREALRFDDAVAASSRSIRSIPAVMTGTYPSQMRTGTEWGWVSIHPDNDMLAEILHRAGYRTQVSMGTWYFQRSHGFFQGFDEVWEDARQSRDALLTHALHTLGELEGESRPWFYWVHGMGTHQPYLEAGETSRFGTRPIDEYDEAIVRQDEMVGQILDAIDHHHMRDDTIVVIWSDHGEAFGEHGVFGHTHTLYEEEIRSTLLMRVPGLEPRVIDERVSLIDVFPTVLNLAHVPLSHDVPSRSLVPLMTGAETSFGDRILLGELLPDGQFPYDRKSLTRGRYRIHWWLREGRFELYDLEADPHEMNDLSDDDRARAQELLGELRAWTSGNSLAEYHWREAIDADRLHGPPSNVDRVLDLNARGLFTLIGYRVDDRDARPGGTLVVDLFFEVHSEMETDYRIVVEATSPTLAVLPHMRAEHVPLNGRYPTTQWREGEFLRDRVPIPIANEIPPGTINLSLQVLENGRAAIRFRDGQSRISLGTATVHPAAGQYPLRPRDAGTADADAGVPDAGR
ncbi:MAG: sulfatase-like hydrolase/transferase [Sandaracinaceae bacterium]